MKANVINEQGFIVSVVGASGLLGRALLDDLPSWISIRWLHLFDSPRNSGEEQTLDDGQGNPISLPVSNLPSTSEAPPDIGIFGDSSLVIFAVNPSIAKPWINACYEEGMAVIDFSGAAASLSPPVFPGLQSSDWISESFSENRIVSVPSPAAHAIAQIVNPFRQLSAWAATAIVQLSASSFGQPGLTELSAQIASLYNAKDSPQTVFPGGLAFDVIDCVGRIDGDGFTAAEQLVQQQCASVLGGLEVTTQIQVIPLFSGGQVLLTIALEEQGSIEQAIELLDAQESLRVSERTVSPKNITGRSVISVGRLRQSTLSNGIRLTASFDNIALTIENCRLLLAVIIEERLL